jgi:HK97 family phage major capsid protein/HK97 family phage prohead protease
MSEHRRAYSVLSIKSVSQTEDQRVIEGIATTPSLDRVNDIVEPLGAKYTLPIPLLWQHRADEPVGQVEMAAPSEAGIPFRARLFKVAEPGEFKNLVDKAWQMLKAGAVRGASIGFKTRESVALKNGGYRIKAWDWFELSLVTIPANAEATILTVKQFDRTPPAAPGQSSGAHLSRPAPRDKTQRNATMQSFTEQIQAHEDKRTEAAERLKALMAKDDDGGTLDEAEANEIETLQNDIANENKKLKSLRLLESSLGSAKPVSPAPAFRAPVPATRYTVPAEAKRPKDQGMGFARKMMCLSRAYYQTGTADYRTAEQIAKQAYPGDHELHAEFKAVVAGGITIDATWAGNLVTPVNYTADFIDYLRETTILGKFGTGGVPALRRIPFNVLIKESTLPGAGYWVGEGSAKPLTSFGFTSTLLTWNKVAAITVLSEEMIRFSTPSAETLVRNLLAEALQARLDTDFIDPAVTATPEVRPASILNGVTNTFASDAVTSAQITEDLKRLVGYFITAKIPLDSLVWIMRQSMAVALSLQVSTLGVRDFPDMTPTGGTLLGFPVIASQYVPLGIAALVAANEIYLADDGGFNVAASREASLQMDNAPTMVVGDTSSPSQPVGVSVVSMFQTNSVAIRSERFINWARRRGLNSAAYASSVGWGNTASSPDGAPI